MTEIKFGVVGDTHFGSKHLQLTALYDFYKKLAYNGIEKVYHCGDLVEGLAMRPSQEDDLYVKDGKSMIDNFVDYYPWHKNITTYCISGNHDASIYKRYRWDAVKAICESRSDFEFLGKENAIINLTPKVTMELRHPWDGSAYAMTYKGQKIIESMYTDQRPDILLLGHYHKASYMHFKGVHCIQPGCFQSQTEESKNRGVIVDVGGWIVTAHINDDDTLAYLTTTYVPYDNRIIKDDYKE